MDLLFMVTFTKAWFRYSGLGKRKGTRRRFDCEGNSLLTSLGSCASHNDVSVFISDDQITFHGYRFQT